MDTRYMVLRRTGGPDWELVEDQVLAHSADGASRQVAEATDTPGTYVAVPARSWNPTEQQKETTTVWKSAKL